MGGTNPDGWARTLYWSIFPLQVYVLVFSKYGSGNSYNVAEISIPGENENVFFCPDFEINFLY